MGQTNNSDIVFNLTAFKNRARRVAKEQGRAYGTLSKVLFKGDNAALRKILDSSEPDSEKTFPRLDTMLRADRALTELEKKLGLVEA